MAMSGNVVIKIDVRTQDTASAGLDKVSRGIDKVSASGQKSITVTAKMRDSFLGLGQGMAASVAKADLMIGALRRLGGMLKGVLDLAAAGERELNVSQSLARIVPDAEEAVARMQKATAGLVEGTDLEIVISRMTRLGIEGSKQTRILELATKAALDQQKSVGDTIGIIEQAFRGRTQALQQIGVMVDAKAAVEEFAEAQGVAAASISETEKKTIILNATIDEMGRQFDGVNMDEFSTGAQRATISIGNFFSDARKAVGGFLDVHRRAVEAQQKTAFFAAAAEAGIAGTAFATDQAARLTAKLGDELERATAAAARGLITPAQLKHIGDFVKDADELEMIFLGLVGNTDDLGAAFAELIDISALAIKGMRAEVDTFVTAGREWNTLQQTSVELIKSSLGLEADRTDALRDQLRIAAGATQLQLDQERAAAKRAGIERDIAATLKEQVESKSVEVFLAATLIAIEQNKSLQAALITESVLSTARAVETAVGKAKKVTRRGGGGGGGGGGAAGGQPIPTAGDIPDGLGGGARLSALRELEGALNGVFEARMQHADVVREIRSAEQDAIQEEIDNQATRLDIEREFNAAINEGRDEVLEREKERAAEALEARREQTAEIVAMANEGVASMLANLSGAEQSLGGVLAFTVSLAGSFEALQKDAPKAAINMGKGLASMVKDEKARAVLMAIIAQAQAWLALAMLPPNIPGFIAGQAASVAFAVAAGTSVSAGKGKSGAAGATGRTSTADSRVSRRDSSSGAGVTVNQYFNSPIIGGSSQEIADGLTGRLRAIDGTGMGAGGAV